MASLDYVYVTYGEPHAARARQMLAAHPELRALAGPFPASALWTLGLVLAQIGLALLVGDRRWFVWLPCAYVDRRHDRSRVVGADPRLLP